VGQPSPVPIPGSDPSGEGEDQPVTVTVVRPNKEKVTIATTMNTTVETFILQFVMTVAGGETEEEQMDRIKGLRFMDARGRQWEHHDKVGIYITPEEVREGTNKVYELYRVRGGGKGSGSKGVRKTVDKAKASEQKLEAKLQRLEAANRNLRDVATRMQQQFNIPAVQHLYNEFKDVLERVDKGEDVIMTSLKKKSKDQLKEWVMRLEPATNASWKMTTLSKAMFEFYQGMDDVKAVVDAANEDVESVMEYVLEKSGYRNMKGDMQWQMLIEKIKMHTTDPH
jgi:hypothetical protein